MAKSLHADFRGAEAHLARATLLRNELGSLLRKTADGFKTSCQQRNASVVVEATYDVNPQLAVVFADWLDAVRTALDYSFLQLTVRDTQQDPPPFQEARLFPIKRTADEFAECLKSNTMRGLSASTIRTVEVMQPYHTTKYGTDGNALMWLRNLSTSNRHRLGARITEFNVNVRSPYSDLITDHELYDYQTVPGLVGGGETLVLATLSCASITNAVLLQPKVEIRISQTLELLDWFREAHSADVAQNIRNDSLEERMKFIEYYMGLAIHQFEQAERFPLTATPVLIEGPSPHD
ncbi:hypothetical protein ACFWBG_24560 [Nocardia salmonicida]|uniref:hypothetical protein n=1 Tax=Nocardia salmonicida TaxID=53431 RepID=UPI0036727A5E